MGELVENHGVAFADAASFQFPSQPTGLLGDSPLSGEEPGTEPDVS